MVGYASSTSNSRQVHPRRATACWMRRKTTAAARSVMSSDIGPSGRCTVSFEVPFVLTKMGNPTDCEFRSRPSKSSWPPLYLEPPRQPTSSGSEEGGGNTDPAGRRSSGYCLRRSRRPRSRSCWMTTRLPPLPPPPTHSHGENRSCGADALFQTQPNGFGVAEASGGAGRLCG